MMVMNNLDILFRNYEKEYIDGAKIELDGPPIFDHISSFDIGNNFGRLMIASKIISSKPNRVSMKFETYDHKFQIQYIDSDIFKDAILLIRTFYTYRQQI